jgi:hypothetical protein
MDTTIIMLVVVEVDIIMEAVVVVNMVHQGLQEA